MKKYRLGLIGGGMDSIAGKPHIIASQMDGRFEVVAGAFSSHPEKSRELEAAFGVPVYDDYRKMVREEELDAVSILTPTPLHFEQCSFLLKETELALICEKPLVSSLQEIVELEKLAGNRFLVVTNNYSGYPMVRELKARIDQGELGEIFHISLEMPQETFLRPPRSIKYPQKWRLHDGFIPMICLDLGVHLHHLAFFLTGSDPKAVQGEFKSFSSYPVIDDVRLLLRYENGMAGSMWVSKSALGHRNGLSFAIYGSRASAFWQQENPEELFLAFSNGTKMTIDRANTCLVANDSKYNRMTAGHVSGFIEAFANVYRDIADCIDQYHSAGSYSSPFVYGLEHAKEGLCLLHCGKEAYLQNRWVDITEEVYVEQG